MVGPRRSESAERTSIDRQERSGSMHGSESLKGRRVVIVGGTSGMGRGAAQAAADAGAEVIVVGRRPTGERVNASSFRHESVDMTDAASVQALFERIGELD